MKLLIAIGFSLLAVASAFARQADPNADLRTQLSARYDILSLQNGVGLVPKDRNTAFRLIEIRDGGVAVDGQSVTGRELRDKIGADADLILRLSYMPLAEQRQIAGADTSAAGAAPVSPPPQ